MRLRTLIPAVLVLTSLPAGAAAQDAASVVAAASKAMAVDTLNSITYSGSARTGTFGQSKSIGEPMGPVNVTQITQYRRTINFGQAADPAALVSRATGPTQPPAVPGVPPPTPGVFNQNITGAQAVSGWTQALNIWTTPWGFLKGAAANTPTVRQQSGVQVVSFTPPNLKSPSGETYSVTGYINPQNLVTKVETRVEHAVAGDLLVEFEYSNYHNMNGVQVPGRIVQRQAGLETFDAAITSATPNPPNLAELLTLPPPAAGAAPAGGAPPAAPARPPTGRKDRRWRFQDRRQLHLPRRRHGRSHPGHRKRPERRARHGGDGRGEAGDPEPADPVRRQLACALRSRRRTWRGGR